MKTNLIIDQLFPDYQHVEYRIGQWIPESANIHYKKLRGDDKKPH